MSGVARASVVVLVLAAVVVVTTAQTFQYSRGWTNGRKRSDSVMPGTGGAVPLLLAPPQPPHPRHPHSSTPLLPPHPAPKTIEERLRDLEAGLSAVIKVNSANFSPGGDDEYYNDN